MDAYGAALFLHLLAILSASGASALVHLAESRIARASSARDALEWHRFAGVTARVFPLAVVTLVATGGFMVSWRHQWAWQLGWVQAGLAGSVALMAAGAVIGVRSARHAKALTVGATAVMHDPVARTLAWMNTCLALGVVFVMAAKPAGAAAFAVLGVFAAAGVLVGASRGAARGRMQAERASA